MHLSPYIMNLRGSGIYHTKFGFSVDECYATLHQEIVCMLVMCIMYNYDKIIFLYM